MARRTLTLMLLVALLGGGSGLCPPLAKGSACPMGDCHDAPAGALEAPSCCCPPAGSAPAAPAGKPALTETAAAGAAGSSLPAVLPPRPVRADGGMAAAPPDPVPLYLLHATLLI